MGVVIKLIEYLRLLAEIRQIPRWMSWQGSPIEWLEITPLEGVGLNPINFTLHYAHFFRVTICFGQNPGHLPKNP